MTVVDAKTFWAEGFDDAEAKGLTVRVGPWRCGPLDWIKDDLTSWACVRDGADSGAHGEAFATRQEAVDWMVDDCLARHDECGQMTRQEILDRIGAIEKAIATQDFTVNHTLILGGEWHGLRKAVGIYGEGVWAMVYRVRGL